MVSCPDQGHEPIEEAEWVEAQIAFLKKRSEVDELQTFVAKQAKKLAMVKQEYNETQSELDTQKDKLSQLRAKEKTLENRLQELTQQKADREAKRIAKENEAQTRLQGLENMIKTAQARINEIRQQCSKLQTETELYRKKQDEAVEHHVEITKEYDSKCKEAVQLFQETENHLLNASAAHDHTLIALRDELTLLRTRASDRISEIQRIENVEWSAQSRRLEEIVSSKQSMSEKERQEMTSRVVDLEEKVARFNTLINRKRIEITALSTSNESLRSQNSEKSNLVASLEDEYTHINDEIKDCVHRNHGECEDIVQEIEQCEMQMQCMKELALKQREEFVQKRDELIVKVAEGERAMARWEEATGIGHEWWSERLCKRKELVELMNECFHKISNLNAQLDAYQHQIHGPDLQIDTSLIEDTNVRSHVLNGPLVTRTLPDDAKRLRQQIEELKKKIAAQYTEMLADGCITQ